jgi:hypothetical protein
MKLYGGIDLHSNNSVIAIKDETGKVLVCKKLPNDWELIQRFLEPYKEMLIVMHNGWLKCLDLIFYLKGIFTLKRTSNARSDAQTHEPSTTINSKLVVYSGHIHAASKLQAQ